MTTNWFNWLNWFNWFNELIQFMNGKVVRCNFHVMQNIEKILKKKKWWRPAATKLLKIFGKYVYRLRAKFWSVRRADLLTQKLSEREGEFCQHFMRQWVYSHCGWYEGYVINSRSTNNAMEGFNSSHFTVASIFMVSTFRNSMLLPAFYGAVSWASEGKRFLCGLKYTHFCKYCLLPRYRHRIFGSWLLIWCFRERLPHQLEPDYRRQSYSI